MTEYKTHMSVKDRQYSYGARHLKSVFWPNFLGKSQVSNQVPQTILNSFLLQLTLFLVKSTPGYVCGSYTSCGQTW